MTGGGLMDERDSAPLRQRIGHLLATARTVDLALARVRLPALDLTEEEVRGPTRCRVLLGRLDASTLLDAAAGGAAPDPSALLRLREWLGSERLEVRSAGIASWTPDFSVYTGRDGMARCLVGAHYFGSPGLTVGPSFTVLMEEPDAARLLAARFQELWRRSHDVSPAIMDVLGRAGAGGAGADTA